MIDEAGPKYAAAYGTLAESVQYTLLSMKSRSTFSLDDARKELEDGIARANLYVKEIHERYAKVLAEEAKDQSVESKTGMTA